MATSAPSSASARAVAAPIPREPPVTRATLPESFLVIGFLHCSNSMTSGYASRLGIEIETEETHCFLKRAICGKHHGKTSGLRSVGDLRKGRGIAVVCGGGNRACAVQGHGLEGGQPIGGAAGGAVVQPHLAAAGADRCWAKIVRARPASFGRRRGAGERGAGAIGDAARAGAARGAYELRGESSGAAIAGVPQNLSGSVDRSSSQRCDRRSDRRRF